MSRIVLVVAETAEKTLAACKRRNSQIAPHSANQRTDSRVLQLTRRLLGSSLRETKEH